MLLYQQPNLVSELFQQTKIVQEDLAAEPIVRPAFYDNKILSSPTYELNYDTLGIYNREQLYLYFNYLQPTLKSITKPITLAVSIGEHAFNIGYHRGRYTFLDANFLNEGKKSITSSELVDILITHYTEPLSFFAQFMISLDTPKDELKYFEQTLTNLKQNPQWIELHLVTEELIVKKNITGYSLLHFAAQFGKEELLRGYILQLSNKQNTLDCVTSDGVTPLYMAAEKGYTNIVKLLLAYLGKNFSAITRVRQLGYSALLIATQQNKIEVVQLLIDALGGNIEEINKPDLEGKTPIYFAAFYGCLQILQILIIACKENKTEINRPRNDGTTPLYVAACLGHVRLVEVLLWVLKGEPEAINFPKNTGETPLFMAAQNGHYEVVIALIRALHADPAAINKACNGRTPLWIAAQNGHYKIVFLLLLALQGDQIEINKAGPKGDTALFKATQNGHLKVVETLIANNADLNQGATVDVNILLTHENNKHCYFALKEFLRQKGFSNQIPGITPLQIAVILGRYDLVITLLNHRALTNAPANSLSLFDLASAAGHRGILQLLTSTRLPPIQQLLEQGFFGDTSKKRSYQQMEKDENTMENEHKRIKPRKISF